MTGGGRRAANSPEPSLPRTGLESRKAPANRQGAGRVGATVRAGPEPLPAVPTEEKGGEPHGGRARPHPGAAESRGEASSSAQHNAACPPHRGLPCRGRPLRPAPAPRRSCTAGGRRRARFKPLPGRMSTGAGAGLGGPTAGRGPAGAAVPPSRPPARSSHLGAARGLRDPPQAMGLSNSPPPPPSPVAAPARGGSAAPGWQRRQKGLPLPGEDALPGCLSKPARTLLWLPSARSFRIPSSETLYY